MSQDLLLKNLVLHFQKIYLLHASPMQCPLKNPPKSHEVTLGECCKVACKAKVMLTYRYASEESKLLEATLPLTSATVSDVVRTWFGGGSDVFSDLVQTVWQKLRESGFQQSEHARVLLTFTAIAVLSVNQVRSFQKTLQERGLKFWLGTRRPGTGVSRALRARSVPGVSPRASPKTGGGVRGSVRRGVCGALRGADTPSDTPSDTLRFRGHSRGHPGPEGPEKLLCLVGEFSKFWLPSSSGSRSENCSANWFSHGLGCKCNSESCSENAPELRVTFSLRQHLFRNWSGSLASE